mgnify:CR=1 FL=1
MSLQRKFDEGVANISARIMGKVLEAAETEAPALSTRAHREGYAAALLVVKALHEQAMRQMLA